MTYNPKIHRDQSLRLKGYDYTNTGAYFVTIVTQGRLCLFGEMVGEEMRLNEGGEMVCRVWEALPRRFPVIEIDVFVVMPNHLHGIIVINQPVARGLVDTRTPDGGVDAPTPDRIALGDVIGAYKSLTTVEYIRGVKTVKWTPFHGRLWQRNYYEHIVRYDESLRSIRQYVLDNPGRWAFDKENPLAKKLKDERL